MGYFVLWIMQNKDMKVNYNDRMGYICAGVYVKQTKKIK